MSVPTPAVETVTTYTYDLRSDPIFTIEDGHKPRSVKIVEVVVEISLDGRLDVNTYGCTLTKAGENKSSRTVLYVGYDVEKPFVEDARKRHVETQL